MQVFRFLVTFIFFPANFLCPVRWSMVRMAWRKWAWSAFS